VYVVESGEFHVFVNKAKVATRGKGAADLACIAFHASMIVAVQARCLASWP
jgi:hypothetical protein